MAQNIFFLNSQRGLENDVEADNFEAVWVIVAIGAENFHLLQRAFVMPSQQFSSAFLFWHQFDGSRFVVWKGKEASGVEAATQKLAFALV